MAVRPRPASARPATGATLLEKKVPVPPARPLSAQKGPNRAFPLPRGAKPQTASGAGARAVRALSGSAKSRRPQGTLKVRKTEVDMLKVPEGPVLRSEPVQRVVVLEGGACVEVHSLRNVISDADLDLVLRLREPSRCRRLRLELVRPGGAGRAALLAAFPQGGHARARLPSLLAVGSRKDVEAELERLELAARSLGEFSPVVVDRAFSGASGVVQLRLLGSLSCLPRHIAGFEKIAPFPRLFERIAESGEVDAMIGKALRLVDQVFNSILPRCTPKPPVLEKVSLLEAFTSMEIYMLDRGNECFGLDYFDGATAGVLEQEHGSLLSDGGSSQDLIRLVAEACGRPQKPSHFFSDFHYKMSQASSFWKMTCCIAVREHEVLPDDVLQDGDGRCWVALGPAAEGDGRQASSPAPRRRQPAVAAVARWLASGLFLYTPVDSGEDELYLRKLICLIACVPESFDLALPGVPGEAAPAVTFAWQLSQHLLRIAGDAAAGERRSSVERPDLHFFWAMLDSAVEMATSAETRCFPERKRLALFGAIAFASRLWAATGKAPEPKWYIELRHKLRAHEGPRLYDASLVERLYVQELGSREAWAACPVTGATYTPLEDRVALEAQSSSAASASAAAAAAAEGGAGAGAGDGEEEEAECGAPRGEAAETAAAAAEGGAEAPSSYRELHALLRRRGRLLVTGGPGSGRSVLLRGLLASAAEDMLQDDDLETLPLRVPVADLADLARAGAADLIQEHIARAFRPEEARALAWESLGGGASGGTGQPFPARYGHQVVVLDGQIFVLGGLGEGNRLLQDVWVSKDQGRSWEEYPQPAWGARYSHQAVVFDGKIVLIAGLGENDKRFRDAWETRDGVVWSELPCPKWSGRGGHKALVMSFTCGTTSPKEHLLILGGNANGNNPLHDAWASDNGGFSWHELEQPPWAARHSFSALAFKDKLVVSGGVGDGGRQFQDVWVMSGQLWKSKGDRPPRTPRAAQRVAEHELPKWTEIRWQQTLQLPWASREGHEMLEFRGQVVVFGGLGSGGEVHSDAWSSPDGVLWSRLPDACWSSAASRYGHRAVIVGGKQVIVGGADRRHRWSGDILRARSLLLAFDSLDAAAAEETAVMSYLDRLLHSEHHHQVLMSTGQAGLDHLKSMHLSSWKFTELQVQSFTEADLIDLCNRRLGDLRPAVAEGIREQFLNSQYMELARTPLLAVMLLHAFSNCQGKTLTRCDIYQSVFELCLQSLEAAKSRETAEFQRWKALGLDSACSELALEVQSHSAHVITNKDLIRLGASEAMDTLVRLGHAGRLVLFEISPEGLQFRHRTMQEYLAAKQLWKRLNSGDALPPWIVREGAGSESAVGCGRFFCALAAESSSLPPQRSGELVEGLGSILRNMARVGDREAVHTLLSMVPNRQALLTTVDTLGLGYTALHLAASHGHQRVSETILELAPDRAVLNAALDSNGFLPLHSAAHSGHEAVVRALLELAGERLALIAAVDKSEQCYTSLHLAARSGHSSVVRALLELAPSPAALNTAVDLSGFTSLHLAAQNGHETAVRVLMSRAHDRGILLTTQNKHDRRTALHLAAERGEVAVVRAVLELAPDRSAFLAMKDKFGQTSLHLAAERGHERTLRVLLEHNSELERSALLFAHERLTGQTALHLAADSGHGGAVRALLQLAPDEALLVRAVDKCGRYTPLHLAAEKGRPAAARALLELTADKAGLLMAEERFAGQLALHLAASAGHDEVVRVLLELAPNRGELLAATDQAGGFTAMHLAAEQGHELVIEALLELAPDRNPPLRAELPRWSGFTPIHLVAYRGHEEAARVLLQLAPDRRALLSLQDRRGRTAAELAADRGRRELQKMLEEAA